MFGNSEKVALAVAEGVAEAMSVAFRARRPTVPPKASRHDGFHEAIAPESFYVLGVEGPLVQGELEWARAWGHEVATPVPAPI